MRTAIFPGSFNPWHKAHEHVLRKALDIFDKVYVARGINGNKAKADAPLPDLNIYNHCVEVIEFSGTLADLTKELSVNLENRKLMDELNYNLDELEYLLGLLGCVVHELHKITKHRH